MPAIIYTLSDPGSGEVRYVGKTVVRPRKRLAQHVADAKAKARTRVHRWINSLGQWPTMTILAVVESHLCAEIEIKAIAQFRARGFNLTNLTDGGEGTLGLKLSEEHREALRQSGKRRGAPRLSAESRARVTAANWGRKASPETLVKLRESHLLIGPKRVRGKGLKSGEVTPEGRANQVAAVRGNKYAIGQKRTPEAIAITSAGIRRSAAIRRNGLIAGPNWEAYTPTRNELRFIKKMVNAVQLQGVM